jgi:hypothetical protein
VISYVRASYMYIIGDPGMVWGKRVRISLKVSAPSLLISILSNTMRMCCESLSRSSSADSSKYLDKGSKAPLMRFCACSSSCSASCSSFWSSTFWMNSGRFEQSSKL